MTFEQLPADLPVPEDDGGADHLTGLPMPSLALPATTGGTVDLTEVPSPRVVVYAYPKTGRPGVAMPGGWDLIPGARGCTPESCDFRDHHGELAALGAGVFGLSSQSTDYQAEAADRLHLPFALLSDERCELADALRLPTFTVEGERLYRRLTLVVRDGRIEHVFYPVFPPDEHAAQVLTWLRAHPADRS
ncbi:MAG TPA: peroxiredoxin [Jatrophihabitantaceae bacterium]|nr:peroxiredoxin [Jatrophihabitantaceae bacterium]